MTQSPTKEPKAEPTSPKAKRQKTAKAPKQAEKLKGESTSFKGVGRFVMALNRFKASLNPTYTYGKRNSGTPELSPPERQSTSGIQRLGSKKGYEHRGHKSAYLFRSLAEAEQTS